MKIYCVQILKWYAQQQIATCKCNATMLRRKIVDNNAYVSFAFYYLQEDQRDSDLTAQTFSVCFVCIAFCLSAFLGPVPST